MTDYKTFLDNGINDFYAGNYTSALDNINKSLELKTDWEISYFYRGVVNQALENLRKLKSYQASLSTTML